MKKKYLIALGLLTTTFVEAQLPVSTTPQNKKFVLEEFTGMKCTFCPDGHKIANQIIDANPGNAFAINIHTTSSYSNPTGPGQPDYRTADGDAISNMPGMSIAGFPQGSNNRETFGGAAMAISRGSWAANAATIIGQSSYVNLASEATIDVTTRQLTVNIEAYYTANSPTSTNRYTVALIQNNINGPQTSGGAYNPSYVNADGTYRHMHMLRDILTNSPLGDSIHTTTMGTTFTRTITYAIPDDYRGVPAELGDLEVVVYITETDRKVMTAAKAPVTFVGFTTVNNASVSDLIDMPEICTNTITPYFTLKNEGSATLTSATIEYSVNGGIASTFNWTGTLAPLQKTKITLNAITFTLNPTNMLNLLVTQVNGVADEATSNNSSVELFNETSAFGNTINYGVTIVQDQYGSETTWKILNDAGATVASGGPYANLAVSGVLSHYHPVILPATGCYKFEILDSFGDGINAGYGAGSAKVIDGQGLTVYTTNGVFGSSVDRYFRSTSNTNTTSGITELVKGDYKIYPNPTSGMINIDFTAHTSDYTFSLIDLQGRTLTTKTYEGLNGTQSVSFVLNGVSTGNYLISISNGTEITTERITVE